MLKKSFIFALLFTFIFALSPANAQVLQSQQNNSSSNGFFSGTTAPSSSSSTSSTPAEALSSLGGSTGSTLDGLISSIKPSYLEAGADTSWFLAKKLVYAGVGSWLGEADKRYAALSVCWACDMLQSAFIVTEGLATRGFFLINRSSSELLKAMLSIWLVIQVAKILMPFGPGGQVSSIFNEIFTKIGLSILAFGLLTTGSGMSSAVVNDSGSLKKAAIHYNDVTFTAYTVVPILNIALNWSEKIIGLGDAVGSSYVSSHYASQAGSGKQFAQNFRFNILASDINAEVNDNAAYCKNVTGNRKISSSSGSLDASRYLNRAIQCRMAGIQQLLAVGLTIGIYSFLQPGESENIWEFFVKDIFSGIFPTVLSQMVAGFLLIFIYGIAIIGFPFVMIEVFFRITIASIMAPLAIAVGVFKPFRQPIRMVVRMILHGGMTILFLGIAVALGASLIRIGILTTVTEYHEEAYHYFYKLVYPQTYGDPWAYDDQCYPIKEKKNVLAGLGSSSAVKEGDSISLITLKKKTQKLYGLKEVDGKVVNNSGAEERTAAINAIDKCYKNLVKLTESLDINTGQASPLNLKLTIRPVIVDAKTLMQAIDGTLLFGIANAGSALQAIKDSSETLASDANKGVLDQKIDISLFGLGKEVGYDDIPDALKGGFLDLTLSSPRLVGNFMYRVAVHKASFWALFFGSALLFFLLQKADGMAGQFAESQFTTGAAAAVAGATTAIATGIAMKGASIGQRRWTMAHSAISNSGKSGE